MVSIERPTSIERRVLAEAVERDFRALIEVLNRNLDGEDAAQLASIRASAERGLKLAKNIVRALDANDNEPFC